MKENNMKKITCEMRASNDLVKQDGYYVCMSTKNEMDTFLLNFSLFMVFCALDAQHIKILSNREEKS